MLSVALTGNVASGKTTVAERWRAAGVTVIDADRVGHAVLEEDPAARAALAETFGPAIERPDGSLDRPALAELAFADVAATARLNAIVHPPLLTRLDAALAEAEGRGERLAVVDAALVFEFGMDRVMDRIVLVTAPLAVREERLQRSRGIGPELARRIMAAQRPDAEKAGRSDFVIHNDGSLEQLEARADAVLAAIRESIHHPKGGHR